MFLVFGFLEWYESTDSEVARHAPLMVEPVELKKTSHRGLEEYRCTVGDRDSFGNLSLSEKLIRDFGLTLPERGEDETPESWFARVEEIVQKVDPRWCVRRQISLCLLDFTKQAMFQDLDPERWPRDKSLEDHPLIKKFFTSEVEDNGENSDAKCGYFQQEHPIDSIANIQERYPLIAEADSSQHSAVIDAVDGKNLIIEGPPGTGKSQTITNLIAAAMASGKRVLFVAEKMDALEVVARRLDKAGLGDFLLELHSHKANKPELLSSLMTASGNRSGYEAPAELDLQLRRLEKLREELSRAASAMNTPWRDTGFTPHEILQYAAESRERSQIVPVALDGITPDALSQEKLEELTGIATRLMGAFDELSAQAEGGDVSAHLWFGVKRSNFIGAERQLLFTSLGAWNDALKKIAGHLRSLDDVLGATAVARMSPSDVSILAESLSKLPDNIPNCMFERVEELASRNDELKKMLVDMQELRSQFSGYSTSLREEILEDHEVARNFRGGLDTLIDNLGISPEAPLKHVEEHPGNIEAFRKTCELLQADISILYRSVPGNLKPAFQGTQRSWELLTEVLQSASGLSREHWAYRDKNLDSSGVDIALAELELEIQGNELTS